MILSVHELKKAQSAKRLKNKELYKELLNGIYFKIKEKNKNGYTNLVYIISPIIPGKPLVNIEHACTYIYKKLTQGNFKVNIVTNKIFIDWS